MIWATWQDFFAMGGYALYVWGSVLVVAGFMLGEIFLLRLRFNAIQKQIARATSGRSRRSA
jgi:heme exporter protein D